MKAESTEFQLTSHLLFALIPPTKGFSFKKNKKSKHFRILASRSNKKERKKENQKRRGALTYRPEGKQPSAWDLSQSGGSSNLRQNDGWHGCYYVIQVWYFCPVAYFINPKSASRES